MSFFTALTGLKGAQTDIATTSNNIANVGSTGFKKSRAEFGDIFSTTPLQTNVIGDTGQSETELVKHEAAIAEKNATAVLERRHQPVSILTFEHRLSRNRNL